MMKFFTSVVTSCKDIAGKLRSIGGKANGIEFILALSAFQRLVNGAYSCNLAMWLSPWQVMARTAPL